MEIEGVDGDAPVLPPQGVDGDVNPLQRGIRRVRAQAAVPNIDAAGQTSLCIFVASGHRSGIHPERCHAAHPDAYHLFDGEQTIGGLAACTWRFFRTTDYLQVPAACQRACRAAQRLVRDEICGFVVYESMDFAVAESWVRVDALGSASLQAAAATVRWSRLSRHGEHTPGDPTMDWCHL